MCLLSGEMKAVCYWEILSHIDFYVALALGIVSLAIFIYIIKITISLIRYERRSKVSIDKKVKIIFLALMLWGLFHIGKIMFELLIYSLKISGMQLSNADESNTTQIVDQQYISKISVIFCALDSSSTVVLQGILILVPYIWTHNILLYLLKSNKIQEFPIRTCFILKLIRLYSVLRYFIYSLVFLLMLVAYNNSHSLASRLCFAINLMIIVESFICICVLGFGLKMLISNFDDLELNRLRDKKKLFREFTILMSVCAIRFLFNLIFILILQEKPDPISTQALPCGITNAYSLQNYLHTIVYLALGIIITHYLPVFLILKFYDFDTTVSYKKKKNSNESISSGYSESNPASVATLLITASLYD